MSITKTREVFSLPNVHYAKMANIIKIHFGKTTIGMEGCSINRLLSGLKTPYFAFGLGHNLVHTKEIISLELKEDLNTTISSKMAYSFLSFKKTK